MDFIKTLPKGLPDPHSFQQLVKKTIKSLVSVPADMRPRDVNDQPGGLLLCNPALTTIIVPDLHGRFAFLTALLRSECSRFDIDCGGTVVDALSQNRLTLLLLGDLFHTERSCIDRWKKAYDAYLEGNVCSNAMKNEMADCLRTVMILMHCICQFPLSVHCLKGNHENVLNREGGGDFPFYKYAAESSMVYDFMLEWGGADVLLEYSEFEQLLPVIAAGGNFLASHAEPRRHFSRSELIGAHNNSDVIAGLTWTKNDEADPAAAGDMLHDFFPDNNRALYFGGHRSINTAYNIRANGMFVQIHNPDKQHVAVLRPGCDFLFETDIRNCT